MVLAASAAGCLETEDDTIQFSDDFETPIYVNWLWGGDVQMVTTTHPGEHAAMIGPGAWMEHVLSINRIVDDPDDQWGQGFSDGNWIEYTTDCTGRPALAIEPFTIPPGADRTARIRLVLDGSGGGEFGRRKLMLPALPAFLGPPDEPGYEEYMIQFRAVRLETGPAAVCTIDNLHLMVSGGTLGY